MIAPGFVAASLVILLTPGPTNTILVASGAAIGVRRGLIMPLAEAIGYMISISLYVVSAQSIHDSPTVLFLVKIIASVWLMYAALRLWKLSLEVHFQSMVAVFLRILITTMLNPKAMFVGVVLIPAETTGHAHLWIATYALMSIFAGTGWVLLGSSMPLSIRLHSYKLASLVLGIFSITAAVSAFS